MNSVLPRPGHHEPCAKRVRVVFGGRTIADSTATQLVWEHVSYPQYYFPRRDVALEHLTPSDRRAHHATLGEAEHFTVVAGGRTAHDAAWQYETSPIEAVRSLLRLDWAAMDNWYEEDEEVFVHPRDPYTRIDVLDSTRRVRVEIDGVVVAESSRPRLLFETRLPTRFYLPPEDVRQDLLTPTTKATLCPYKGTACYWSAEIGGVVHSDVVWSYPEPVAEAAGIAGLLCFYNERVDLVVDGERQPRPVTKFS